MSIKSTQKALSDLLKLIHKAKRRKKYSKDFADEVRTIISRLNIITSQSEKLTSLNRAIYPSEIDIDWYKEKGKNHFDYTYFDPDDDYYADDEEFEKLVVQELKNYVKICEDIVNNALYELEQIETPKKVPVKKIDKPLKVPVNQTSKPKTVPERKITPIAKEKIKKDETIGDFKIPIPFTDIKIPIKNQRELGIFLLGIFVGILITLSTLMGFNFLFG